MLTTTSATAAIPARARGTVVAVADGFIAVKDHAGRIVRLITGARTKYAEVVASDLDAIKLHEYIGTAVKRTREGWVAVEIVIVPQSMRAGRRGFYAWDPLPDTSGVASTSNTSTSVKNGSVGAISTAPPAMTDTTMTNGPIADIKEREGVRLLTVNLVGNSPIDIAVTTTAPITKFVPADRSAVSVGSRTVVWTAPDGSAVLVAVGRGITPPM
jgi:hypothetical protein